MNMSMLDNDMLASDVLVMLSRFSLETITQRRTNKVRRILTNEDIVFIITLLVAENDLVNCCPILCLLDTSLAISKYMFGQTVANCKATDTDRCINIDEIGCRFKWVCY